MTLFQHQPILRKIAVASSVALWGLFSLWMVHHKISSEKPSEVPPVQQEPTVQVFVSSSIEYPVTTVEMTEVQMLDGHVVYLSTTTQLLP